MGARLGRSAGLALALLGAGVPAAPRAQVAAESAEVEREQRARALALAPGEHAAALEAALGDARWTERHAALDALARSPAGVAFAARRRPALARLALDPHPNVRAAALVLAARLDPPLVLEREVTQRLAADPWPGVRAALAPFVAAQGDDARALALARDPDPAVASAARRAIVGLGPEGAPLVAALLAELGGERALDLAAQLHAAGFAPELARALRARFAGEGASPRALVEALALLAGGAYEVAPLVRAAREGADPRLEPWLEAAAASGEEALGPALVDEGGRAAAQDDEAGARRLLGLGARALAPQEALVRALPLADAHPALAARVLGVLAERADELAHADRALAPWLAVEREAGVRAAAADLASAALDARVEGARAVLLGLLDDPDPALRVEAFRRLSDLEPPELPLEELAAAWARAGPGERLEALRVLPRAVAPTPFRAALVELGAQPATRTPSVVELLATFRGDAEVAARLAGWLDGALDALAAATSTDERARVEGEARGLARALAAVAGADATAALERALERSLAVDAAAPPGPSGADPELAKTAAALLGRSAEGRRALVRFLAAPVQGRVRLEAALAVAPDAALGADARRAEELLLERFGSCDAVLRGRILEALGRVASEASAAFLARVADAREEPLDTRLAALSALAARGDLARLLVLDAACDGAHDFDLRRALLAELGAAGGEEVRAHLVRAHAELAAAALTDADAAVLAGDALLALARSGPLPAELRRAALDRALAFADEDLAARFALAPRPATDFRYRSELRLAEVCAARGSLPALVGAAGEWWRADGRLLGRLAELAADADDAQSAALAGELALAAWVALEGEPAAEGREDARARALALLLDAARQRADWSAFGFACARLGELGERSPRAFERVLGTLDPRAGRDPAAWLAAAYEQARASAALAAGDGDARARAREHAERAARRLGRSRAAAAAQERLEAALAATERPAPQAAEPTPGARRSEGDGRGVD